MKTLLYLLSAIALAFSAPLYAQPAGTLDIELNIRNNQGAPMANAKITLVETATLERKTAPTDAMGKVKFHLDHGKFWQINILEIHGYAVIQVPDRGSSQSRKTITYDPKVWAREHRPPVDRSLLTITTEKQRVTPSTQMPTGKSMVVLTVKQADRRPLPNYPVALTCFELQKTYTARTDGRGMARFMVPNGKEYEVDIDDLEGYKWIDTWPKSSRVGMQFTYQPTEVVETIANDTITQKITENTVSSSGRALVTVNARDVQGQLLGNETVYLHMLKSNKVYQAKTNGRGEAEFLLPHTYKYMLHFNFERDVDVVDLSQMKGIGRAGVSVSYRPDPRLQFPERYIPTPQTLFTKSFQSFVEQQVPPPNPGKKVRLLARFANKVNAQSKEAVLELGFSVTRETTGKGGPGINVCFVIDRSGSMAGYDRIERLRESLATFMNALRPTDRVSVVAFNHDMQVLIPSQLKGDGKHLQDAILDIQAGGGTNIHVGLMEGYKQVAANLVPKGVNRVVLLTDGFGSTPVDKIVGDSKGWNAKGIELSCVGVGAGYNQALLTHLATVGGGLLHYAGAAEDIDRAFAAELESVLLPIGTDMHVEVEYNKKIIYRQLYGFPTVQQSPTVVAMRQNTMQPGLNKLALVKFDLHQPSASIMDQPVIVRLAYTDVETGKHVMVEERAALEWTDYSETLPLLMEQQQKKLYCIAIMNQSLKVMAENFAIEDEVAARNAITSALEQVNRVYPDASDADVQELVRELNTYSHALRQYQKNAAQR